MALKVLGTFQEVTFSLGLATKKRMSQAIVGQWVEEKNIFTKTASVVFGVAFLAALAQVAIPLPFTPVPITGQTFGVALLSLLWGRKWGMATVLLYVIAGTAGLPIFAQGAAGLKFASSGYLVGMCMSSVVIGTLADMGWAKSFGKAYLACLLGSVCTFACGLVVLSNFVPKASLLTAGLLPFIPGDLIKSLLAATIVSKFSKKV
jgi:biotin transport system substrate-specific component